MPPEPTVLAFDTSAAHCAAALLRGGAVVAAAHEEMSKGQAERLMPLLEEVLAETGASWQDLDRIGVGIGPGNFTGIRISVAAARGLALGLGIPALGVSSLDAVAFGTPGPVLACLAAPRGMAYLQGHAMSAEIAPQMADPEHIPPEWAEPNLACLGSAADAVAERLGAKTAPAAHSPASAIGHLAALRPVIAGEAPVPVYLRPADAAPSKERGPKILT